MPALVVGLLPSPEWRARHADRGHRNAPSGFPSPSRGPRRSAPSGWSRPSSGWRSRYCGVDRRGRSWRWVPMALGAAGRPGPDRPVDCCPWTTGRQPPATSGRHCWPARLSRSGSGAVARQQQRIDRPDHALWIVIGSRGGAELCVATSTWPARLLTAPPAPTAGRFVASCRGAGHGLPPSSFMTIAFRVPVRAVGPGYSVGHGSRQARGRVGTQVIAAPLMRTRGTHRTDRSAAPVPDPEPADRLPSTLSRRCRFLIVYVTLINVLLVSVSISITSAVMATVPTESGRCRRIGDRRSPWGQSWRWSS